MYELPDAMVEIVAAWVSDLEEGLHSPGTWCVVPASAAMMLLVAYACCAARSSERNTITILCAADAWDGGVGGSGAVHIVVPG